MIELTSSVESTKSGDTFRLKVTGSISGDNLQQIEADVMARVSPVNTPELVFDLSDSTYLDSRGITLCVRLYKMCMAKKIHLTVETNSVIFRLLSSTNLTSVMNIIQTID